VRLAANHAINRQAVNESETLGYSIPTGSIIPRKFDGVLVLEPYPYDPKKAKQLLTEAGYASGFEGGDCTVDIAFTGLGEALVNDLTAVGIRTKMRPMERAPDQAAHRDKTHKTLALQGSGALMPLCTARGRSRGLKTRRLTHGMPNKPRSVTASNGKRYCTRSSKSYTMRCAFCRSGTSAAWVHQDRGWQYRAWA
jgi:ABC-type transport system substrate-binding protein